MTLNLVWREGGREERNEGTGETRLREVEEREGGREGRRYYTLTKSRMSPMGRLLRPCSISSPFSIPNHEMPGAAAREGGREGGRERGREGKGQR